MSVFKHFGCNRNHQENENEFCLGLRARVMRRTMHSSMKKVLLLIAMSIIMTSLLNLIYETREKVPYIKQVNKFDNPTVTNRNYMCPKTGFDFIRAVGGKLYFADDVLINYHRLKCQYFDQKWIEMKPSRTLKLSLVPVKCTYKGIMVYNDYLPLLPEITLPSWKPQHNAPCILVFVIGSVSREVFRRRMVKTVEVLNKVDGLEFTEMNVLGPTTLENINSLLCGQFHKDCQPSQYIWNEFKSLGYLTGYAEDSNKDSTFKHIKDLGFHYQWNNTIEQFRGTNWISSNYPFCIKNKKNHELLLKYTTQVFLKAKNKKRALFFLGITNAARDSEEVLSFMDDDFAKFIGDIYNMDLLSNTFIYFLSDHGFARGDSHSDSIQERMQPFAYLVVPPRFKCRHSFSYKSLWENRNRLITHKDFYQSMRQLLARATSYDFYLNMSIFSPFKSNRTCEQAGVPVQFCASTPMQECTNCNITTAANAVVNFINELLTHHSNCEKLSLEYVEDVKLDVENNLYVLDVRTSPGNGLFEGYVRENLGKLSVLHVIALHNYFPKSRCEIRRHVKPFCTCSERLLSVIDNFVFIEP